jgi:hypothetical protein
MIARPNKGLSFALAGNWWIEFQTHGVRTQELESGLHLKVREAVRRFLEVEFIAGGTQNK